MLAAILFAPGRAFTQPDPTASAREAQALYETFLAAYRDPASTRQDLLRIKPSLEKAQSLAPDTYKYRFSLGALNHSLGSYAEAVTWFDRALELASSPDERNAIAFARQDCRLEMIKEEIARQAASSEPYNLQISFIMKQGTLEMERGTLEKLPQRLPIAPPAETAQLVAALFSRVGKLTTIERGDLLIAGWGPESTLADSYDRGFKDHYAYLASRYSRGPLKRKLVVMLSENIDQLFQATQRLYPEAKIPAYAPFLGYYNPADNLIMATSGRSGYGTLLHELVHALIKNDFQRTAPMWIDEGLASLYERTRWAQNRLEALPNWRMDSLKEDSVSSLAAIAATSTKPDLSTKDIAEIRLLFLYVASTGGMDKLYGLARDGTELGAALTALTLNEQGWRSFVAETFRAYRAELSIERGALSNPDEVRFVQQALNASISAGLAIDGLWGATTEDKLVEFQRKFGLAPDGLVGAKTMAELRRQFGLRGMQ
jgi:hypothetical protein